MSTIYDQIMQEALAKAKTPLHEASDDLRDTLAMINSQRASRGYPLLESFTDAVKGNTAECLYARAYGDMTPGVSVSGHGTISFPSSPLGKELAFELSRMPGAEMIDMHTVRAPRAFARVIKSFDHGEFPEFGDE